MPKLKFLVICIAIILNVLLCNKLSTMIINKKSTPNTEIEEINDTSNDPYKNRDSFYSLNDKSINRRSSEHFQIIWGNDDNSNIINSDFIEGNLANLENMRKVYIDTLEMKDTGKSIKNKSGKYKTNIYLSDTGLKKIKNKNQYTGCDDDGFAYIIVSPSLIRVDPPSWVLAQKYAHAVILHQGGALDNNWSDAMANWLRNQYLGSDKYCHNDTIYGPASSFFKSIVLNSNLAFPQEKNAYDSWPFITYISENPDNLEGLGIELIHTILENDDITNPFDAITKNTKISLQDVIGNYSKRMITMDFARQNNYLTYLKELKSDSANNDIIFTNLDLPKNSWVSIPDDKAPQQGGYNIIPINNYNENSSITVDFKGIKNKDTDDWRATIVAFNKDKSTTYSSTWNDGENTLKLSGNEVAVYLIVAATPKTFQDISKIDADKITSYPYKIKLISTEDTTAENADNSKDSNDTNISSNNNSSNNSDNSDDTINNSDSNNTNKPSATKDKIKVEMYNKINQPVYNNITPCFRITNAGKTSINLKNIKIRYYYTKDGNEKQVFECDWCSFDSNSITANFGSINKGNNADYYLDLSFNSNEVLKPNGNIYLYGRIHKNNWTNFNQSNDYSFNSSSNDYVEWKKVTAYIDGTLVWGNEP
ncbi:Hypothetical protein CM240_1793 [Clostridium bornimense]|uniref:CBM3 domain-containing protein n=1 Tax=Clostridium bornimense TaxID=1216932 RepID=W6RW99_9CLOT|nr:DUF6055 domain-containing protein [Clostridium bornimense]CDM68951.1 Hypothetical protein CM240_1793 [Clostridium bornimense]